MGQCLAEQGGPLRQRLPVVATVAAAYREWWRACSALRTLVFSAFVILLAVAAVSDFIPQRFWDQGLLGEVLSLAQQAIRSVLLAPILIGIHRFVILDETARGYAFPAGEPIFWTFVAWLFGLDILTGLPLDLLGLMQALNVPVWTSTFIFIVLLAAVVLALRLSILLPAIAVDAPGIRPALALADTRGYALRMLAITVLAAIPWLAVSAIGTWLVGRRIDVVGSFPAMISLLMTGALQTISLSLMTVIVSLVFVALGAKIKRPLPAI
jgi:hypothetical protein